MDRSQRGDEWSTAEREQFWEIVRSRMAVRRLHQRQVAKAIGRDRSALSHRLSGEIRERPTPWMLDTLLRVLRPGDADAKCLSRLAGLVMSTAPETKGAGEQASSPVPPSPVHRPASCVSASTYTIARNRRT